MMQQKRLGELYSATFRPSSLAIRCVVMISHVLIISAVMMTVVTAAVPVD